MAVGAGNGNALRRWPPESKVRYSFGSYRNMPIPFSISMAVSWCGIGFLFMCLMPLQGQHDVASRRCVQGEQLKC